MEHTRAFLAYDTLCRIAAEIPEDGEQLLEQCEEEAHGLERTLSMFDPDSELSRLCRDIRPGEAVPVSETLYTFLEQNLEICRLSGGAGGKAVGFSVPDAPDPLCGAHPGGAGPGGLSARPPGPEYADRDV